MKEGQTYGRKYKRTDGRTEEWMDRRKEGQTDGRKK